MKAIALSVGALGYCALLAGCAAPAPANQALLTYKSVPEGAQLFEGNLALGVEPVTRTYKGDGKSVSITTPDVTAVWPSGAKTSFYTILDPGADRVATLERPVNAPGLDADLENARKIAAARAQEERRLKEETARDIARHSARCQAQLSGGGAPGIDDCK